MHFETAPPFFFDCSHFMLLVSFFAPFFVLFSLFCEQPISLFLPWRCPISCLQCMYLFLPYLFYFISEFHTRFSYVYIRMNTCMDAPQVFSLKASVQRCFRLFSALLMVCAFLVASSDVRCLYCQGSKSISICAACLIQRKGEGGRSVGFACTSSKTQMD